MSSPTTAKPEVFAFFDKDTATFSYVVKDPSSKACAVIDSVMNIDYPSGTITFTGADRILAFIREQGLQVEWLLETHVHADHLSAAPYLQQHTGGKIGIGEQITVVQGVFGKIFNAGTEFKRDGSQFDKLFRDEEEYRLGNLLARALHTPGHTPACMTYVIGDAAFVGDTLFMPDQGTARADFPGGDARTLYRSIQRVLSLPPETRLFMCHDYPEKREVEFVTTVAAEKAHNIHVHDGIAEDAFVQRREARDATLAMPRLILPSLQVNMRAGHLPPPASSERELLQLLVHQHGGEEGVDVVTRGHEGWREVHGRRARGQKDLRQGGQGVESRLHLRGRRRAERDRWVIRGLVHGRDERLRLALAHGRGHAALVEQRAGALRSPAGDLEEGAIGK